MAESLLSIILTLVVLGVIVWAVREIVAVLPLDATIRRVVDVLVLVVVIVIVVSVLARLLGMPLHMAL